MVAARYFLFTLFLFYLSLATFSQGLPYTNPVYAIRKDSAISFGTATNYCGNLFELKMNIYKPIGDNNLARPVIIFVHGGAFTSGNDFNEYHMNVLAQEFAKRGYVAASLDYREGHHLYGYGISLPAPIGLGIALNWDDAARTFVADSAEVLRSVFRAQQDIKAAIRFMKQNHVADSSAICKVFIAGHSAGGIAVTAAAFMDQASAKSSLAGSISDVPNPNWISDGFYFFGNWVITQINGPQDRDDLAYRTHNPAPFNYEAASCYSRPDLGSIDGSLNTATGYDATVIGAASLCGAVIDTNVFAGPRKPALYMYHIPNDIVVPFNSGYPFTYTADLLTPAPYNKWPVFYGSNWIKGKLQRLNYPAAWNLQQYDNGGNPTNSHDLLPNDLIVADSIAKFFAKVLDTSSACSLIVLPVKQEFTVLKQGTEALLKWKIDNSSNTIRQFILQRSGDGVNFAIIKSINATSAELYEETDPTPLQGMNYYRLQVIYMNRLEYSVIRTLLFQEFAQPVIFPNPVSREFTIAWPAPQQSQKIFIEIINQLGHTVIRRQKISPGQIDIINTETLHNGAYTLRIIDDKGLIQVRKFVVLH